MSLGSKFYDFAHYRPFTAILLVGALFITSVVTLSMTASSVSCHDVEVQTGLHTKYSILSGCYVKVDNDWVPVERWREYRVLKNE